MTDRNPMPTKSRLATANPLRAAALAERPRIDSAILLRGARELVITHNGESYYLHVTRNEKLILTK